MDNASLSNFLSDNAMPLFGELNGDTFDRYLQEGKGLVWSLFPTDLTVEGVQKENRPMMTEVAKKIRGKYFVTYTDTDKFKDAIDSMLGVTTFPAVAVQKKAGDKKKYVYTGEMSAEKISGFIADSRLRPPAWFLDVFDDTVRCTENSDLQVFRICFSLICCSMSFECVSSLASSANAKMEIKFSCCSCSLSIYSHSMTPSKSTVFLKNKQLYSCNTQPPVNQRKFASSDLVTKDVDADRIQPTFKSQAEPTGVEDVKVIVASTLQKDPCWRVEMGTKISNGICIPE